jgi:Holliday junction DNA helicase RuvA
MIAFVEGVVDSTENDALVVSVGGIGLRVYTSTNTLSRAGRSGERVRLHTHLHLREDTIALYGFATPEELELFELLLTVSGVGPRNALAVLSAMPVNQLRSAIATENAELLMRVPGIGRKTAARIVLELRGKVSAPAGVAPQLLAPQSDVIAALTALGYSAAEAMEAIREAQLDPALPEAERVRRALQYLGTRR